MSVPTIDRVTLVDERTGTAHQIPVHDGALDAEALRTIPIGPNGTGLVSFDPGYSNTAACRSAITYIDGDRGRLEYRGYPIEQLAPRCSFLEVAYLLIRGELPGSELMSWKSAIMDQSQLPEGIEAVIRQTPVRAHPTNVLAAVVSLIGGIYPEARQLTSADTRELNARRLIGQMPLIAASIYRHHAALPPAVPQLERGYVANFLHMMFQGTGRRYDDPRVRKALEILLVLHADHEQNCSTSTLRGIASSDADPFAAAAGAIGALSGPLHGGANEAVLRMLREIGRVDRVPEFIEHVKAGKGRLMGFGHRVYKNFDPRGLIVKQVAYDVFKATGTNPLLDVALELERCALADEYFITRKLYPNVDFYSGLVYEAIGLPAEMFTVIFAVARTAGWVAHWLEFEADPDKRIARPRQIYVGPRRRDLPALAP